MQRHIWFLIENLHLNFFYFGFLHLNLKVYFKKSKIYLGFKCNFANLVNQTFYYQAVENVKNLKFRSQTEQGQGEAFNNMAPSIQPNCHPWLLSKIKK